MVIPTPEQFERLSKSAEIYVTGFSEYLRKNLAAYPEDKIPYEDVDRLVQLTIKGSEDFFQSSLDLDGLACINWLESEPAFALAIREVGFHVADPAHWAESHEKTIRSWIRNGGHTAVLAFRLARNTSRYLAYISRLGGAIHSYVSGTGLRAAINGAATIARMRQLLLEFDQLAGVDWMPVDAKKRLSYMVKTESAIRFLDSDEIFDQPATKRNDADLPSRLLALEILRLNYSLRSKYHKRAVFHLMGLSIIERPIEMRTIERLVKSETDAHRKYMAKRIADKKGLDYERVLTTLKAAKKPTFQS